MIYNRVLGAKRFYAKKQKPLVFNIDTDPAVEPLKPYKTSLWLIEATQWICEDLLPHVPERNIPAVLETRGMVPGGATFGLSLHKPSIIADPNRYGSYVQYLQRDVVFYIPQP